MGGGEESMDFYGADLTRVDGKSKISKNHLQY